MYLQSKKENEKILISIRVERYILNDIAQKYGKISRTNAIKDLISKALYTNK